MNFSIENPMPPLWLMYPNISQYSIGWRMGYGEGYKFDLFDWLKKLSSDEKQRYIEMFPAPKLWRNYWDESEDSDSDETEEESCFNYEYIQFWNKNGEMKYDRDKITLEYNSGKKQEFIFFWKPDDSKVDKSCFSQWQKSPFEVDVCDYSYAEQYMMAEKAQLFEDDDIEEEIMAVTTPKKMKDLGQKVRNFNQQVWDKCKYSIVLAGNYYKFTQDKEMMNFLLSTGNKVLVEASPLDKIWGIGLSEEHPDVQNPNLWKGQNLLGFALMEVRDEIKRVYANYDKINWSLFEKYL